MKGSPRLFVLLACLLLAGIAFFIWRKEECPPSRDRHIRGDIRRALNYSGPDKWERFLLAGIDAGRAVGMDLEELTRISLTIPEKYRLPFFDGAAHGIDWPSEDMESCLAAIKKFIPTRYQPDLFHGPIIDLVREEGGDPERVMPLLVTLPREMQPQLSNGLRIGLLLVYRERLEEAVPVILRYPPEFRHHIFEEFGWWMGQTRGADTAAVAELAEKVPEVYREGTYHGYIRGLRLGERVEDYEKVITALDPAYRDSCYWALIDKMRGWYGEEQMSKKKYYDELSREMEKGKNLSPRKIPAPFSE